MRYILSLILLSLFFQSLYGQYYETGEDPASLRWLEIKTSRFKVLYPESYGKAGIDFARSLDQSYSKLESLYPEKKFRLPVIIHNYSIQSNGYVSWAPSRMEIYPAPEQNSIPLDPIKQLTLHELAHVDELTSLKNGLSHVMSIILGEQYIGALSSLLPLWYLEGDAVFSESILSSSGRGRSPSFMKQFKAIAVEKGNYGYDKALNSSFRDYVPDHYQLGYQMVTWARVNYNMQIWNNVLRFTAEQPFTIIPVNISLRNNTGGLNKRKLYRETFDTLRTLWTREAKDATVYENINPDKKGEYVNYYSPLYAGNDSILAIKTSLFAPPAFVLINPSDKSEKTLARPAYMNPYLLSYSKGKLVWVETKPDPRWANREFSVIRVLDIKKNITKTLAQRTRYMAASISPDGRTVAAIENSVSGIDKLVLLDSKNGTVINSFTPQGNPYLQRPVWSSDGNIITVIFLQGDKEGIMAFSMNERRWTVLLKAGNNDLQSAFYRNDTLFFVSSRSGTENIFFKAPGKEIRQLTKSTFGVNDPSFSGSKIIFSNYSSKGNSIAVSDINNSYPSQYFDSASYLISRIHLPEKPGIITDTGTYTPVHYRKWQHLFRFHSWMPFYADLERIQSDPLSVRPGFTIMSQNDLSTLISSIGYEYSDRRENLIHTKITWKGWYPVVESQLDYGGYSNVVGSPEGHMPATRFTNVISVPLRYTTGWFTHYIRPSFSAEFSNNMYRISEAGTYDNNQLVFTGRLYFSNYSRSALRDIYPRWAQTIDLNYVFSPFDRELFGDDKFVKTAFFFPGFMRNNSIRIRFEKESKEQSLYSTWNRISWPRGFDNILSREMDFVSAEYALPLFYPDFNIDGLLYLKRFRSSVFYDYASGKGNRHFLRLSDGSLQTVYIDNREDFRSGGFQLLADFHILRIPFMISAGVQAAWKDLSGKPTITTLFNLDMYGFNFGK
jgi:hypothetical protein